MHVQDGQLQMLVVRMTISLDSPRTGDDVYFKYFESSNVGDAEPGEAFHTAEIFAGR